MHEDFLPSQQMLQTETVALEAVVGLVQAPVPHRISHFDVDLVLVEIDRICSRTRRTMEKLVNRICGICSNAVCTKRKHPWRRFYTKYH